MDFILRGSLEATTTLSNMHAVSVYTSRRTKFSNEEVGFKQEPYQDGTLIKYPNPSILPREINVPRLVETILVTNTNSARANIGKQWF